VLMLIDIKGEIVHPASASQIAFMDRTHDS